MKLSYLKNVASLDLATDKCTGCGKCLEVCPHNVLELVNGKAVIVNKDSCMECGACSMNCAFSAITVNAGVGCAFAVIAGLLSGKEPSCDCGSGDCC